MRHERLTRRSLMLGGASVLAGTALGGCAVSDPTMSGPKPTQLVASRAPLTQSAEIAALESGLAEAAATLAVSDSKNADRFASLSQAHRLHATALSDEEPLSRPSPDASPAQPPAKASKKQQKALSKEQTEQLKEVRETASAAAEAETGLRALLLASVAAFAAAAPALGRSGTVAIGSPAPQVLASSEGGAAADLLRQLYAIVYGYQAAAAPLRAASQARKECMARLAAHERLSDTLVDALAASKTEVPVAEPVYALPYRMSNADKSAKLRAQMEAALLPYLGSWLAVAGDSRVSQLAVAGLLDGAAAAAKLGGTVPTWPGFND